MTVPWIKEFNPLTSGGQMSFQGGCLVEESVTISALKGLEHCINNADVANVIIVSQQSDSILVFLHTSPSGFTYDFSVDNVYFKKKNVQLQNVPNN